MAITQAAIDMKTYKKESQGATWNNRKQAAQTRIANEAPPVKRYKGKKTGRDMFDHPNYDFIKGRLKVREIKIAGEDYDVLSSQKGGAWGIRREFYPIIWFRDCAYLVSYINKVNAFYRAVQPQPTPKRDPMWHDKATARTQEIATALVALYDGRYNVSNGKITPPLKVYREGWGRRIEFKNARFTKSFLTVTGLDGEPNKWGIKRVQKELRNKILVITGPRPDWATYEAARSAIGK